MRVGKLIPIGTVSKKRGKSTKTDSSLILSSVCSSLSEDVRFGPSPGVPATWTLLELAPETTETMLAWLQYRGLEPGALFTAVSKADKPLLGRRISPSGIGYLFKVYCQMLGINKLTPHDSRRTYCSNVLDVPGI